MEFENSGSFPPPDARTLTDPVQVRILTDVKAKEFFKPFLGRERTVSEAAREVGCGLNTMLYRVRTFLAAGLLEVTRRRERKGRPIKHYRSVADAFFLPFAATPFADLEERYRAQMRPVADVLASGLALAHRSTPEQGEYLFRDEAGTVWTSPSASRRRRAVPPGELPAAFRDIRLHLASGDAEMLLREFERVLEEVRMREGAVGDRQYVLQFALVPYAGAYAGAEEGT